MFFGFQAKLLFEALASASFRGAFVRPRVSFSSANVFLRRVSERFMMFLGGEMVRSLDGSIGFLEKQSVISLL